MNHADVYFVYDHLWYDWDPVTALILSAIILKESLSILGIAGAVLILGSAYLSERRSSS